MTSSTSGSRRFRPRTDPHRVTDLASLIGAGLHTPDRETTVRGVTLRAQEAVPGDLFAALPGGSVHGAQFAAEAIAAGATAVLTDPAGADLLAEKARGAVVLCHENPRAVLGQLAAAVYGYPSDRLRVVGITGTSGKTTTAYLVEAGLRAAGHRVGLIGTVGVRIDGVDQSSALTTPEAPALQELLAHMVQNDVDTVVMEVSSHALALGRVGGTRFDVAAFTNLSRDHLDFHPDMQDYFATKARLFDPKSPLRARRSVICIDDEAGRAMAELAGETGVVTASASGAQAGWRARRVDGRAHAGTGRQIFVAVDPTGAEQPVSIDLPGDYNVANALVALAVIDALGVDWQRAARGMAGAGVPGRMESVDAGQDFLAIVDYAHKPGALRAVLESLHRSGGARLAVVFGAGGNRDRGKRAEMGRVAAELSDLVVVTDDNPRDEDPAEIRREIISGTKGLDETVEIVEIGDRRAAIAFAVRWARPGDTVLVAGKGHEAGQRTAAVTVPFDDRTELRKALAEIGDKR